MPHRPENFLDKLLSAYGVKTVEIAAVLIGATIVAILRSPAARIWFGLVIIGSVLVAGYLRLGRKDDS